MISTPEDRARESFCQSCGCAFFFIVLGAFASILFGCVAKTLNDYYQRNVEIHQHIKEIEKRMQDAEEKVRELEGKK